MPGKVLRWLFHSPQRLLSAAITATVGLALGIWALNASTTASPPGTSAVSPSAQATSAEPDAAEEGSAASTPTPVERASSKRGASASSSSTRSPSGGSEHVRQGQRSQAKAAARSFLRAWLSGRQVEVDRADWLARVRPHVTPDLLAGIELTDPSQLPVGRVGRVEVTAMGAFVADTTARLGPGTSLRLRLVDQGGSWAVADVQEQRAP